jgi:hypothetical protein
VAGSTATHVETYATYEMDGEDPGPSAWPIVTETAEVEAYAQYCAGPYTVVVLDKFGVATFHAYTNLLVPEQRQGLLDAIDAALAL